MFRERRLFNSLRFRLAALTFICALIAMLPITIYLIERSANTLEAQLDQNLKEIAQMKQGQLQHHHDLIAKMAIALGSSATVKNLFKTGENSQELFDICQNFQESYWGIIHHTLLINTEGEVIFSPNKTGQEMNSHLGENVGESPFFEKGLKTMTVTDFFGFSEKDHYHQILFQPVIEDGTTLGVIGLEICIDYVDAILSRGINNQAISIFLTTLEGQKIVNLTKDRQAPVETTATTEARNKGFFNGTTTGHAGVASYVYYSRSPDAPWILCVEEDVQTIANQVNESKQTSLKAAIVALLFAILVGLWAASRIAKPIIGLNKQILRGIKENDLNIEVRGSSLSEIKTMAHGFSGFLGKIRDLIHEVRDTSSTIEDTTHNLNKEAHQLMDVNNAVQTNYRAASQATTSIGEHTIELSLQTKRAQEMVASVNQATEDMGASLEQVSAQAMESDKMVSRTEEAMEKLRQSIEAVSGNLEAGGQVREEVLKKVQEASKIREKLDKSARAVDEITRVIEKLADQTSLLALNATIEAEKAGEAGRSFAVVALDVKKLAGQSSESAEKINKQIHEMQVGAQEIGHAIEDIANTVSRLHQMGIEVGQAMQNQIDTTQSVNQIVHEESGLLEEITGGVTNVAAGVSQILTQLDALVKYLSTVDESAETSTELCAHVRQSIDNMGTDCQQLSNVVETLNNSSQEMQQRFQRLDTLVAPYKT